jgi:orotidine-5'-phosphate decarboxylase
MRDISPEKRIIFPLDLPTLTTAMVFVDRLKESVGTFKIGLELFTSMGPRAVGSVKERAPGCSIFLDIKFHDIPATVAGAAASASALGVEFVTAHCSDGPGMLRAAVVAAPEVKVLGVTVLTSLRVEELTASGIDTEKFATPADLVLHRARIAKEAGCAGVVCSGLEARAVREEAGEDFLIIVPGIRRETDGADDQSRITTPYEAIYNGADYIVVGRPIRKADDPARVAADISREIETALKDRGS